MSWGKPRTSLGEWMYKNKISNKWLEEATGLNKNTITAASSDKNHRPHEETKREIIKALRRHDPDVSATDFW